MTDKNDSAFVFNVGFLNQDNPLNKREYFAAMAMQGLLSTGNARPIGGKSLMQTVASDACVAADALIEALNK